MKIGANMPCLCGSGNKYKRCCRDKQAAVEIRKMVEADISHLHTMSASDKAEADMINKGIEGIVNKHIDLEYAYIAESNGEIVGFVQGMETPENIPNEFRNTSGELELSIQQLYVKPRYRGEEIGVQLMKAIENKSEHSRFMVFHDPKWQGYYMKQGYIYGANPTIGRKVIT